MRLLDLREPPDEIRNKRKRDDRVKKPSSKLRSQRRERVRANPDRTFGQAFSQDAEKAVLRRETSTHTLFFSTFAG